MTAVVLGLTYAAIVGFLAGTGWGLFTGPVEPARARVIGVWMMGAAAWLMIFSAIYLTALGN